MLQTLTPILAQMTQDQVIRSIRDNANESGNPVGFLFVVLGLVGVIVLILVLGSTKRRVSPVGIKGVKRLHHHGKLVKEMNKVLGLRPADAKRLKAMAAEHDLESPLTLLLCPSLLKKGKTPAAPARKAA